MNVSDFFQSSLFFWLWASACLFFASALAVALWRDRIATRRLLAARRLLGHIDVQELGEIEAMIPGLRKVSVFSHRVESPSDSLLLAVRKNFSNGVHYSFRVSPSMRNEANSYHEIFRSIAKAENDGKDPPDVKIGTLPIEWAEQVPLVFYHFVSGEEERMIAYRGTLKGEGIDERYLSVDPKVAHAVYAALTASDDLKAEQFIGAFEAAGDNIVNFSVEKKHDRRRA